VVGSAGTAVGGAGRQRHWRTAQAGRRTRRRSRTRAGDVRSLGFTGEALLRDHIRDRDGELHDLVMLAHFVDGAWASMETVGLSDELAYSEELGKEGSPR
jgi:hypothetical protein